MYRDYTQQLNTIISLLRDLVSGQGLLTDSVTEAIHSIDELTAIIFFLAGAVTALIIVKLWDWLEKKTRL